MREKIAQLFYQYELEINDMKLHSGLAYADKILALFPSLDGIVVEDECKFCKGGTIGFYNAHEDEIGHESPCPDCHGTGTITRPAEWGDIKLTLGTGDANGIILATLSCKSGGRLKVKE